MLIFLYLLQIEEVKMWLEEWVRTSKVFLFSQLVCLICVYEGSLLDILCNLCLHLFPLFLKKPLCHLHLYSPVIECIQIIDNLASHGSCITVIHLSFTPSIFGLASFEVQGFLRYLGTDLEPIINWVQKEDPYPDFQVGSSGEPLTSLPATSCQLPTCRIFSQTQNALLLFFRFAN